MSIVRVALDLPLLRLFDYLAPGASASDIGYRVSVPFGRSLRMGVIVDWIATSEQPVDKLKPVTAILRDIPPLPTDWLALCEFCARYYQAPLGEVMAFALPPMLRRGKHPRPQKAKKDLNAVSAKHESKPASTVCLPSLLAAQQAAVEQIVSTTAFQTFLLHGVTGSGKTEVYLRAIEATLAQGRQALMLVPEIALTPQLESRVRARLPHAHLVVANSSVADAARARGFLDALTGNAEIVLGTRLAIFTPLPRLRLIIVDEEHDASFKQQDGVRYSARDLAIWRAHQQNCPIVLGSATPSLESFHHALAGRYHMLTLPLRAVAEAPPIVRTIDTRREKLQEGLSVALINALEQRLGRGEQSLVFLNRRGYAPVLACPACGWISRCQHCAANLVVHLADKHLRCHHCGFETAIPHACPDCGNVDLQPFGRGTQRLESALIERFPQARILRVDRDSANSAKKWQALLASIHAGEVDILIGTQMLAKGHDFPKLTLVGAVGADAALFAADFRAPERLFAQLMQVGGRSGRADLPGEVLIQTEYPTHPLYQALIDHDYSRFAQSQLEERKTAGFPPFTFQAMLRAESRSMGESVAFLAQARDFALAFADSYITLYEPVPMRLHRLMALERAQLLVESDNRPALQHFLAQWQTALYTLKRPRTLRWHVDVDPLEF
ncbi:primosomal protein DnaI [Rugosibacter aromaticivorans]|uniref:Replication restart protein PriA n=1 Tax=Rugosibacter aromaticivorans TaxID=1565605 RepID=A0A0C5JBQ5_9PROT|nr:primosomal protein N' [Rugosibacter aromaticivorans]AJP49273.1 primosomal protein DnaI [Rugosibacter aromaticivorans]TBR16518.1 MAG: primosomal protein N' [Rugosibacter sp.]